MKSQGPLFRRAMHRLGGSRVEAHAGALIVAPDASQLYRHARSPRSANVHPSLEHTNEQAIPKSPHTRARATYLG